MAKIEQRSRMAPSLAALPFIVAGLSDTVQQSELRWLSMRARLKIKSAPSNELANGELGLQGQSSYR